MITYPGGFLVTKACVSSSQCSSIKVPLIAFEYSMSCCTTDGCNSAGLLKYKLSIILASLFLTIIFILKN